jgi:protoheme IX farnesyltransferase
VRGGLDIEAWALFFVLFFWQMPHFLALGWMYRKDYQRAEFPLLVVVDADGNVVARQALIYACALVIAGIMPTLVGLCGTLYFITSLPATVAFAWIAVRFRRDRSNTNARRLFFASLVVLPVLFGLMITERLVH